MKCPACEKDFVKLSPSDEQCSIECRDRWDEIVEQKEADKIAARQKRLEVKNTRKCPYCKENFVKKHNRQKYCSLKCGRNGSKNKWMKKNAAKVKAYKRKYYYAHREEVLAYQREWKLKKDAKEKVESKNRLLEATGDQGELSQKSPTAE